MADLVRDENRRGGKTAKRGDQRAAFGVHVASGLHEIGEPQGEAIDQRRRVGVERGQRAGEAEGFLHRAPCGAASGPVRGDARRHFLVAGARSGDIDRTPPAGGDQALREPALARPRPAEHQRDRGERFPGFGFAVHRAYPRPGPRRSAGLGGCSIAAVSAFATRIVSPLSVMRQGRYPAAVARRMASFAVDAAISITPSRAARRCEPRDTRSGDRRR